MTDKTPGLILLGDPLTEVTRKARRNLLGASAIAIAIAYAGLVPTKVTALGIGFTASDQTALLRVAAGIVVYFLVTFVIYGLNDRLAWGKKLQHAIIKRESDRWDLAQDKREFVEKLTQDVSDRFTRRFEYLLQPSEKMAKVRAIVEYLVPILVGGLAIWSLLTYEPLGP